MFVLVGTRGIVDSLNVNIGTSAHTVRVPTQLLSVRPGCKRQIAMGVREVEQPLEVAKGAPPDHDGWWISSNSVMGETPVLLILLCYAVLSCWPIMIYIIMIWH